MNKLLIITATHERPSFFKLLEKWVKAQTFKQFDWLVVTDGSIDNYQFTMKQKVIRRDPSNNRLPSLNENILEALKHVEGYDKLVFMEDDDYYNKHYLAQMNEALDKHDLVGFAKDVYYYVMARRIYRCLNETHASLAATALTQKALPWLKKCCEGDEFIDSRLWITGLVNEEVNLDGRCVLRTRHVEHYKGKMQLYDNFTGYPIEEIAPLNALGIHNEEPRHIGIKGNPFNETPGLSKFGHKIKGAEDIWGHKLIDWIGEKDAAEYLKFTAVPKFGTNESDRRFLPDPNMRKIFAQTLVVGNK